MLLKAKEFEPSVGTRGTKVCLTIFLYLLISHVQV